MNEVIAVKVKVDSNGAFLGYIEEAHYNVKDFDDDNINLTLYCTNGNRVVYNIANLISYTLVQYDVESSNEPPVSILGEDYVPITVQDVDPINEE